MTNQIEVVAEPNNLCGEGPIWDPRENRLLWVDIINRHVYQLREGRAEPEIISRGLTVSGVALMEDDSLLLAGAAGIHLWRGQDDYDTIATEHEGEKLAINDIVADPAGRLYAGSLFWPDGKMEKLGKLYLVDNDGSVRVVDEGIELSNGLGFSPDDRTLYYADSTARAIYAYDVDASTGTLSNRRVLVRVGTDEGIPDGLTVDSEGYIWSAQWYGAQIVRYDPDGAVHSRVPMPVKQVSCVTFGGPDCTDLYVTTAASSWVGPHAPAGYDFDAPNIGGSLYRLRTDVPGRPERRCKIAVPAE